MESWVLNVKRRSTNNIPYIGQASSSPELLMQRLFDVNQTWSEAFRLTGVRATGQLKENGGNLKTGGDNSLSQDRLNMSEHTSAS